MTSSTSTPPRSTRIALATESVRPAIYRLRHEVYARELGQHAVRDEGILSDTLDAANIYITAEIAGKLAGFISITPPSAGRFSIETYIERSALPIDATTYELRILTVDPSHRNSRIMWYLVYAAFRWVEEQGGTRILALGRKEVLDLYLALGAELLGKQVRSGAVDFELMSFSPTQLRRYSEQRHLQFKRLERSVDWKLPFPFFKRSACFHGGAFFDDIGVGFNTLDRRTTIINADVLDAWFPPSPRVLSTIHEHLPWLMQTSAPTLCDGLRESIATHRGVRFENIVPGAGSSDLIYLAFRQWLHSGSRVLILDPTYGEYAHVLENVIGCRVDRLALSRRNGYQVNLDELATGVRQGYDLVVLVNPNNPTGRHIQRRDLEPILSSLPARTLVWIDEAYLDYVGAEQSLEQFAAASENIIVCKSMSKVYALSGMRVAYLCTAAARVAELLPLTPPWAVGLAAQVAAVRALEDSAYYRAQYARTHELRRSMYNSLQSLGIDDIVPGVTNSLMFHLDDRQPSASEVVQRCRHAGVFLRDVSSMGRGLGRRVLRIAIKDQPANAIVVDTLASILHASAPALSHALPSSRRTAPPAALHLLPVG
ncbi:MAG TPA: aminotransferase class I/II-fold pyridoxal phosphate-dependent enzyme [Candidatus Aquilonibacter sp.]|nr:aminotransferase class I/II-fold pyridoxal phosphate-dependent enzyme [Candidatus Aquilonibacter sp.]